MGSAASAARRFTDFGADMTRRMFLRLVFGALALLGLKKRLKVAVESSRVSYKEAEFYRRIES